jgi:hypothetical protein
LLKAEVFDQLEGHFKKTHKWRSLDNAFVNFTHWALVKGGPGDIPYQKKGFLGSWIRQNGYICQRNFRAIDLVIPMAFRSQGTLDAESLCYILISLKNSGGTEGITLPYLPRDAVEGVVSHNNKRKAADKTVRAAKSFKTDTGGRGVRNKSTVDREYDGTGKSGGEKVEIQPPNKHLNVRLTLNSLKFVNPGGIPDTRPTSIDSWIMPSKDKPFIAFAMSMGQTHREKDLFVAEKNVNPDMCLINLVDYAQLTSHRICIKGPHEYIHLRRQCSSGGTHGY